MVVGKTPTMQEPVFSSNAKIALGIPYAGQDAVQGNPNKVTA